MNWQCGVTTVEARRHDLLPRTLDSLVNAGFPLPRLFVDGSEDVEGYRRQFPTLLTTFRVPAVRAFANWALGLGELYLRDPKADRYAMFQDDIVCCKNLREYLDKVLYPAKGYWNLFTFMDNDVLVKGQSKGFMESAWSQPNSKNRSIHQMGRGALALVFDREAVVTLLTHWHMVRRAYGPYAWYRIDGGVVEAMNQAGFKEHIHNPSLVQHTGTVSSLHRDVRKRRNVSKKWRLQACTFPGENFDAMELLCEENPAKCASALPV